MMIAILFGVPAGLLAGVLAYLSGRGLFLCLLAYTFGTLAGAAPVFVLLGFRDRLAQRRRDARRHPPVSPVRPGRGI